MRHAQRIETVARLPRADRERLAHEVGVDILDRRLLAASAEVRQLVDGDGRDVNPGLDAEGIVDQDEAVAVDSRHIIGGEEACAGMGFRQGFDNIVDHGSRETIRAQEFEKESVLRTEAGQVG